MTYPLPIGIMNKTQGPVTGLAKWVNTVSDGYFWMFIVLAFSVVTFISAARYTTDRAFGWASFVGMMASILFAISGLMAWKFASIFIILGMIGIVWMIVKKEF